MNEVFIVATLSLVFIVVAACVEIRKRKRTSIFDKKKNQLKGLHKNEAFFLCYAVGDLGKDLFQFDGEPYGVSLRSGMRIVDPRGAEHTVKEIYYDDGTPQSTPDKPVSAIPEGTTDAAIVIETKSFNVQHFRQKLKNEKVLALQLR